MRQASSSAPAAVIAMPVVGRLPRHPSLPEQISDEIIRLAALGRYALGERLPEVELAREFGVSRVPVREALRLLESRGITVSTPNRGMRLMTVTERNLHEMLTVRVSLEKLAVTELLARDAPLPLDELSGSLDAIRLGAERDDSNGVAAADLAFHRSLCTASENAVLLGFWDTLSTKMMIIFGAATRTKNLARLVETHARLFACLQTGSAAEIGHAIERHILHDSELEGIMQPAPDMPRPPLP